jgi:hypothetical protein
MLTNTHKEASSGKHVWKNPFLYSSIVIAIVLLYVSWILFSRWHENRNIDRRAAGKRSEERMEQDRKALEQFGGKELAIQSFYANPGIIHRGEKTQLCYGVANAKTVKIEPQSGPVWPSYANCVDVSPRKDTTYTLTVQDAGGNAKTQTLQVKVIR